MRIRRIVSVSATLQRSYVPNPTDSIRGSSMQSEILIDPRSSMHSSTRGHSGRNTSFAEVSVTQKHAIRVFANTRRREFAQTSRTVLRELESANIRNGNQHNSITRTAKPPADPPAPPSAPESRMPPAPLPKTAASPQKSAAAPPLPERPTAMPIPISRRMTESGTHSPSRRHGTLWRPSPSNKQGNVSSRTLGHRSPYPQRAAREAVRPFPSLPADSIAAEGALAVPEPARHQPRVRLITPHRNISTQKYPSPDNCWPSPTNLCVLPPCGGRIHK